MTDKVPAPHPPETLTVAGAKYAEHLAGLVKDTGDPDWIATTDALTVLQVAGNVRVAYRAWDAQWEPYERDLVAVLRRANVPDAQMAKALGMERQNFARRHGRRGQS